MLGRKGLLDTVNHSSLLHACFRGKRIDRLLSSEQIGWRFLWPFNFLIVLTLSFFLGTPTRTAPKVANGKAASSSSSSSSSSDDSEEEKAAAISKKVWIITATREERGLVVKGTVSISWQD